MPRVLLSLAGALGLLLLLPARGTSHEVPERVALTLLLNPEGRQLQLLVRVPLASMRDVDFPERANGSLDIVRLGPLLTEAAGVWLTSTIRLYENGVPLPPGTVQEMRIAPPGDRSWSSMAEALRAIRAPADSLLEVRRDQAWFDVLIVFPIESAASRFALDAPLAHLGVRTTSIVRLVLPNRNERAFQYAGDVGRMELDPSWWNAARTFIRLGFTHILGGFDHLLFVCCLIIPVRRWRPLLAIVTSFTVAHSLSLAAALLGYTPTALFFPPLVETLIAASIVFMAAENVLQSPERLERRWPLAFGFGLVHGLGFSFALQESMQFAGSHFVASLAAFNVGVELGQLLVLALVVPVLAFLFARVARPYALTAVLSLLVGHSAWHWMVERGSTLLSYDLSLSLSPLELTLLALRIALLLVVAAAVAWGLSGVFSRLSAPSRESAPRV